MKVLHILVRHHLRWEAFDDAVAFYETLLGQQPRLRVEPLPGRLRIAQIGSMLLVGAAPDLLDAVSAIQAAYLVDDLAAYAETLPRRGATIVEPLSPIATGHYMVVRHPDGLLVEYVEHTHKHPLDRMVES